MKRYIPIPFLFLFMLSCEEEIIKLVEKIETDTVIKYIDRTFIGIDTLEIKTVITEYDTVLVATIDSVFIYNTIHDTIWIHHYHDTLVWIVGRTLELIDEELKPIVRQFYSDAAAYGWTTYGENLLIEPWTAEEMPPAGRSSTAYFIHGQFIMKLLESLSIDESYTPIYRELARSELGKKYTSDYNQIMSPEFAPTRILFSDSDEAKKAYLDELFAQ